MLLAGDVGNTNVTFGVYDDQKLATSFRLNTKVNRTSDEIGVLITELLVRNRIDCDQISAAVIASVVPDMMHSLISAIVRYLGVSPLIVGPGIKTGIRVLTDNPKEVGADKIVDAVAAFEKYGGPVLVLDFGTATTYDLVDAEGTFMYGIIAPGVRTAARALWEDAAKLPEVEIRKPKTILAKETISSMQAGIYFGQIGQTEYIIRKFREESGLDKMKVVATGGMGRIIAEGTNMIDVYDANLTLEGLRLIYEKNRT